ASTIPAATLTELAGALQAAIGTDSTGTGAGSVGWTFSIADHDFDFLAQGETLTVPYTVTVTDPFGVSTQQTVTMVIAGSNDAPVISSSTQSATLTELPLTTGSAALDITSPVPTGSLNFTDVDLTDTHSVGVSMTSAVWSGGPAVPDATQADLLAALSTTLHDSTGTGSGGVDWTFSIADKDLDFLARNETLNLTYEVTVTDSFGQTSTQTVSIKVTGTDDAPTFDSGPQTAGVSEQ